MKCVNLDHLKKKIKKITEITILQIVLHAKHSLDMQARF